MYGTIFRMRPKAGRAAELAALFQELYDTRERVVEGARAAYVLAPSKRPGELIGVAVFTNPETYENNAKSPEQHQEYLKFRELLDADPEWEDGEYVMAASGNPDAVRVANAGFAAFNAHDLDAVTRLVAPDCPVRDQALGLNLVGPAGLRQYWQTWWNGMSDARVELQSNVATDDGTVVTEFLGKGTHDGPLVGPGGQVIPPTGRSVSTHFCQVATVKDGQFTEARIYHDLLGLLAQLGIGG